jgi:hypothetical protein
MRRIHHRDIKAQRRHRERGLASLKAKSKKFAES